MKHLLLTFLIAVSLTGMSQAEDTGNAEDEPVETETNGTQPPSNPEQNAAAPPPPPRKPPQRLDLKRGMLIAHDLKEKGEGKTQIHWFRENQPDTYLGLYTPEYGPKPEGYALILHDNKQHPDWPGIIHQLRSQLPAGGWSTLAISLPDLWHITDNPEREADEMAVETPIETPDSAEESSNAEASGSTEETDTSDAPSTTQEAAAESEPANEAAADTPQDASETASEPTTPPPAKSVAFTQLSVELKPEEVPKTVEERVQEGLDFLKSKDPMPVIVISVGTSATWVAKQAHAFRMKDIAGLVIIDPVPSTDPNYQVSEDASGLRIPVLDLAPEMGARSSPALRKRSAKQQARNTYEQQIIPASTKGFIGQEDYIVKKVRGWAKRVIINKSRFGYL